MLRPDPIAIAWLRKEHPEWHFEARNMGFRWEYVGHRLGRQVTIERQCTVVGGDDYASVWTVHNNAGQTATYDMWKHCVRGPRGGFFADFEPTDRDLIKCITELPPWLQVQLGKGMNLIFHDEKFDTDIRRNIVWSMALYGRKDELIVELKKAMYRRPTPRQVLGARIRAEAERYKESHRKPYAGGWEVPTRDATLRHLSTKFNMEPIDVSYFMTWSRQCTHPWSDGACGICPT